MVENYTRYIEYREQEEEFYRKHVETIGRNLFKNAFGLTLGTEKPNGDIVGRESRERLATAFFSFTTRNQDGRIFQKDIPADLEISGFFVDRMMGAATITFRWDFKEEDSGRSFNHLAVDALVRTGEVVIRTGGEVLFRQQPPLSAKGENPFLLAVRKAILNPVRGIEPTDND